MSNKQVEDAAIAFVVAHEQAAGRTATDVRYTGAAGDVESTGRVIEIKAFGKSARTEGFLWLEARQYDEAQTNPDFWVYVVDNVTQGDPDQFGLVMLGGEQLTALLARVKEHRNYTVPLPVALYDEHRRQGQVGST